MLHAWEVGTMVVSWDKTDSRIWFATWEEGDPAIRLYLVAETLPHPGGGGWDWSVWQSDRPVIVRRGVAPTAQEAADAAEAAAARWWARGNPLRKN
jgi:hypothetical protein